MNALMSAFLEFPWDKIAAFFGAMIGGLTLMSLLMPRFGRARRWLGDNVQDMLGIGGLRRDLIAYIEKHEGAHDEDSAATNRSIQLLADEVAKFARTSNENITKGGGA